MGQLDVPHLAKRMLDAVGTFLGHDLHQGQRPTLKARGFAG
jgi:hypothetical protein